MEDDLRDAPAEAVGGEDQVPKVEVRPARGRTFLPEVTSVDFSSARRGYDRAEVDQYVERVSRIVVELEAMRSPDAVIERALADVGEETSAILRRARKAAEEILADAEAQASERMAHVETEASERMAHAQAEARELREEADHYSARVRAEAEQVLSDAQAQAKQITAEAAEQARRVREDTDRYRAQVGGHIEQLAQERHRLIEDLRKLADQFHRTADRAVEQIPTHDVSYDAGEGTTGRARTEAGSA